jgi:thioester reductase-like protein
MRTHNVLALHNILYFAGCGRTKPLLHAATLFAATRITDEGVVDESFPARSDLGESIKWGYLRSKFVGEKLLAEAKERGFPITVIRFPVMFGDSRTGYIPSGYNHIWMGILASIRLRIIPRQQFNGIPIMGVDSAAIVGLGLFLKDGTEDGLYNLTIESMDLETDVMEVLTEYGISMEFVSFEEWRDAVFDEGNEGGMGPLAALYANDGKDSKIFSMHSLAREAGTINVTTFSEKMVRNLPEVSDIVVPAGTVARRHLEAHFQGGVIGGTEI